MIRMGKHRIYQREFVCHLHWLGWPFISFGFHVHLMHPNIELHLPFCYVRIGWQGIMDPRFRLRCFGILTTPQREAMEYHKRQDELWGHD